MRGSIYTIDVVAVKSSKCGARNAAGASMQDVIDNAGIRCQPLDQALEERPLARRTRGNELMWETGCLAPPNYFSFAKVTLGAYDENRITEILSKISSV
jgi:hypothetical protein